ncbi:MAG: hypothetical protein FWF00_02325 [Endomicrobia bacterium]|nr:hypothetical protein [Endomicrobiia bacterium]MCL2506512.1 hypothetical protein [Endomicrobiia bacterium]
MSKESRQENPLIKLYIIILFFCGIGLWFAMQSQPKQKMSVDLELDKRVIDVLVANGVTQSDILSQYIRERTTSSAEWNEFYKRIRLQSGKKSDAFEMSFRSIARSMKLGLSKTENLDGSVTYKFYAPNRNYSNITFVESPQKSGKK